MKERKERKQTHNNKWGKKKQNEHTEYYVIFRLLLPIDEKYLNGLGWKSSNPENWET